MTPAISIYPLFLHYYINESMGKKWGEKMTFSITIETPSLLILFTMKCYAKFINKQQSCCISLRFLKLIYTNLLILMDSNLAKLLFDSVILYLDIYSRHLVCKNSTLPYYNRKRLKNNLNILPIPLHPDGEFLLYFMHSVY